MAVRPERRRVDRLRHRYAPDAEVRVFFTTDDGNIGNGVVFENDGCAGNGRWVSARSVVSVRTGFGVGTIQRRAQSWAYAG